MKKLLVKIIFVLGIIFLFGAYALQIHAGSLNKYAEDESAPAYNQQFSPDEVKRRLNNKMYRSIQLLNEMEGAEKQRWINEYKVRLREAEESMDYLKAAYYRGILEQVE